MDHLLLSLVLLLLLVVVVVVVVAAAAAAAAAGRPALRERLGFHAPAMGRVLHEGPRDVNVV